ncbi:hypothetical protein [Reticulibacter mediterranei]|uniref:hypothetical protein n=1 Tax=Reticulibacter mediterranei TaxID=2778369 RepID=UPI001C689294|nr:hypothetical protein [Reticulibacter mediterranei]
MPDSYFSFILRLREGGVQACAAFPQTTSPSHGCLLALPSKTGVYIRRRGREGIGGEEIPPRGCRGLSRVRIDATLLQGIGHHDLRHLPDRASRPIGREGALRLVVADERVSRVGDEPIAQLLAMRGRYLSCQSLLNTAEAVVDLEIDLHVSRTPAPLARHELHPRAREHDTPIGIPRERRQAHFERLVRSHIEGLREVDLRVACDRLHVVVGLIHPSPISRREIGA